MRSKSKEIPINSEIFKLNHKWTVTHRPFTHATPKSFQTQNIDAVRTVMFAFTPNMTSLQTLKMSASKFGRNAASDENQDAQSRAS